MTWPPSNSDESAASSSFLRLHEKVQRWIWKNEWRELRDVQERAIPPILEGRKDVILAAATAAGKTEAAFLPITSCLIGTSRPGVACLYVSPLKALINDQCGRLDELCEEMEIAVHRWHGDVSVDQKRKVLRDPSGVLLITPESVEAMMVLHGTAIPSLFAGLRYTVIDELHSFIGSERGRQLQSLLHRIERAVRRRVPRIGLSATLGDMDLAAEFLRPGDGPGVELIVDAGKESQELRMQMLGFESPAAQPLPTADPHVARIVVNAGDPDDGASPSPFDPVTPGSDARKPSRGSVDSDEECEDPGFDRLCDHLYRHLRGTHNLVFANSRRHVERVADRLRRTSERQRVPNEFLPHHGSLAKALREEVESRLKQGSLPLTAICTSTLEMGIDIGSVESIAQVGAPPSVASLRQRLGRSGRRGSPAVLRMYALEDGLTARSSVGDALRAETVQSIAMLELVLQRWCEPPASGAFHYSTLVQQVLSLIAQYGGIRAMEAWRVLCESGPFATVDRARFAHLLRGLGQREILAQMGEGTLVLGALGERIVNHYQFYSAFVSSEEYRVVHGSRTLGQLPMSRPLQPDIHLIFGGRRWKVVDVDADARVIEVVPSAGGQVPRFDGSAGAVHDRVRRQMFDVYQSAEVPIYLSCGARELLRQGRDTFARLGLDDQRVVAEGQTVLVFPWAGDRVMDTLVLALVAPYREVGRDAIAVRIENSTAECVRDQLRRLLEAGPIDTLALARSAKDPTQEKYDNLVPVELAAEDFAARKLDGPGAEAAIRDMIGR